MMTDRTCRWGIMGTALIARKNWKSIWNAENCTLVAVGSRDIGRAQSFISECQRQVPFKPAPQAVGDYEALLNSDIDAVYIPLPTALRKQWVIRAAEAGKHVMCEKPCGVNAGDVQEMLAACRQNNVQFMDGVMFMHSQRLKRMRETLADGNSVGQIKRIAIQFSFCADADWLQNNIRTAGELEPFGCLGDLGWYTIRIALAAMDWQLPQRVSGRMLSSFQREGGSASVPTEFSAEMFFAGGVSAGFYCSFVADQQQWVNISGTKGYLHVADFVLPYYSNEVSFEVSNHVFDLAGCDFNMEQHTRRVAVPEYASGTPNAQETNLFRNFAELVLASRRDSFWDEVALKTQQVMDACLASARSGSEVAVPC